MMANLSINVHFWTTSDDLKLDDNLLSFNKYYPKKYEKKNYIKEKITYNESRGVLSKPESKWMNNLLNNLHDMEMTFTKSKIIKSVWLTRNILEIYTQNFTIFTMTIDEFSGDVANISKDTSFSSNSKLSSSVSVFDGGFRSIFPEKSGLDISPRALPSTTALVTSSFIILTYNDVNIVEMLTLSSPRFGVEMVKKMMMMGTGTGAVGEGAKVKPSSLSSSFKQRYITTVDNTRMNIASNVSHNLILVWSSSGNIMIFFPGNSGLETVASTKVDNRFWGVRFSQYNADTLLSIETTSSSSTTQVHVCKYTFQSGVINKVMTATVNSQSSLVSCDWSRDENRVCLANQSAELFLLNINTTVVKCAKCSIVANMIRWHSNNSIIIIISRNGDMQFYDVALNVLRLLVNNVESNVLVLSTFLKNATVSSVESNFNHTRRQTKLLEVADATLVAAENGPLMVVMTSLGVLGHDYDSKHIFNDYLRRGMIAESLELLHSLDWGFEPQTTFHCLSSFVHHVIAGLHRHHHHGDGDVIGLVQSCLSKFYSPTNRIPELVAIDYGKPMNDLARKYFRLLLRYKLLEKCYLLAIDLQQKDLFMDLYYSAKENGETALADCSRRVGWSLGAGGGCRDYIPDDRDDVQSLDSMDDMQDDDGDDDGDYDGDVGDGEDKDVDHHHHHHHQQQQQPGVISPYQEILLRNESSTQIAKQQEFFLFTNME